MIQVMVVDDEERARTGIQSLIDWQEHGICIVAEARDGAEALELLKEHHVDILLTDIRMPEIDGLRLIEILNDQYPEIKSIIMSGYDDFQYAKKALALGASDYLLKPSRRQEILETVLRLADQIHAEKNQMLLLEKLKKGFRESLPFLRDNALSRLVLSDDAPYEKLLSKLELSGLTFPYPFFGIVRVQIDNYLAYHDRYGTFDIELLKYGLKNICEETLSKSAYCVAFEDQDDIIVLLNSELEQDVSELLPATQELKQNVSQYLNTSVSISVGSVNKQISQLRLAYSAATSMLDCKFYMGPGKIIDYEDSSDDEPLKSSYPIELEKLILQSVLSGEVDHIKGNIELFRQTLNDKRNSKDDVLKYTFALYFAIYRLCIEKDLNVNRIFGQDLEGISEKLRKSTLENIYNVLLSTALLASEELSERKQSNKLFDSILEYIQKNYDKDISRDTVANEVFITPGYLSLLFKQQLKMNFLDFLHKTRIEHACTLLKDPGKRISDIALQVGYNDEKYFFQVFKKYMGMTPKQYRNTMNI